MPQPDAEPTDTTAVKAYLSIPEGDVADDELIDAACAAVNVFVRRTEYARRHGLTDPAPADWPADLTRGATMLAARLHRRRNSPNGVEAFAVGGPVYVRRNDPDIGMMLNLDSPMVG